MGGLTVCIRQPIFFYINEESFMLKKVNDTIAELENLGWSCNKSTPKEIVLTKNTHKINMLPSGIFWVDGDKATTYTIRDLKKKKFARLGY
jgi:hypothetical protein